MNKVGAKLSCVTCGAQLIVVKGGTGTVSCHAQQMTDAKPKPTPSQ
jgi:ribosomal protein S27E